MVKFFSKRGGFLEPLFAPFRSASPSPTSTDGVGGTAVWSGNVDQKESDSKLLGVERYKTFSNILANCSVVAAGARLYLNLIGKAQWKFEPAIGDDINEDQAADFAKRVEVILGDMTTPWSRVVRRASMYRFYGFSVQEWTAKRRDDGDLGFLDIEPRPQLTIERWDLDESGTVFGVLQRSPQTSKEHYLPRAKLLYIVDDSINDSPEGLGLFRHVVEPSRRLQRYEQLEGYAFEADLRGIPIGRAPITELDAMVKAGTISAATKEAYVAGMKTFLQQHIKNPELGLLLDSAVYETADERRAPSGAPQWDLQLLTGGATSQEAVAKTIERLNREIARVLGVEGMLLGESAGSRSLGESKSDTLAQVVDSSLEEIQQAVQSDVLERLFSINGWPMEMVPTAKTEALQHRELTEITTALRDLGNAAAAIGPEDEAFGEIFDLAGLTRPVFDAMRAARDEALGEANLAGGPVLPGNVPAEPAAGSSGSDDPLETEEEGDR